MSNEHVTVQAALDCMGRGLEWALQRRFMCVVGFPMAISQTGEEYVSVTHDGERTLNLEPDLVILRPEGCFHGEEAFARLAMAIAVYCEGRAGTLYWRVRPEITQHGNGRWDAYARLLISDKPILWRSIEEYEAHSRAAQAAVLTAEDEVIRDRCSPRKNEGKIVGVAIRIPAVAPQAALETVHK